VGLVPDHRLGEIQVEKGRPPHIVALVIEFPPGASIAIPPAIFRHSNVAVQQDENRFSITQYTSAGIFRFVNGGFKTDK
jgi:hypothetical protein